MSAHIEPSASTANVSEDSRRVSRDASHASGWIDCSPRIAASMFVCFEIFWIVMMYVAYFSGAVAENKYMTIEIATSSISSLDALGTSASTSLTMDHAMCNSFVVDIRTDRIYDSALLCRFPSLNESVQPIVISHVTCREGTVLFALGTCAMISGFAALFMVSACFLCAKRALAHVIWVITSVILCAAIAAHVAFLAIVSTIMTRSEFPGDPLAFHSTPMYGLFCTATACHVAMFALSMIVRACDLCWK